MISLHFADSAKGSNCLQEASVKVTALEKCAEEYSNDTDIAVIDEKVICAGGSGKDTCQVCWSGPMRSGTKGTDCPATLQRHSTSLKNEKKVIFIVCLRIFYSACKVKNLGR